MIDVSATPIGQRSPSGTSTNGRASAWPSLERDIELLGTPRSSRPARVAITSYEFNGIVRNGGIGTACTSLAKALAAEGHEVDLFFTGWADDPSEAAFERWRAEYARHGARLHWFDYSQLAFEYDAPIYSAAHSLALYEQLRQRDAERPYDAIHFVESVGHGFYSLLAKRQGLAFQHATTVVGVHSPRRWMAEAHGQPFDSPEYLGDEFLERRGIELADVVISPSAHMLDWLSAKDVRLPKRSYVQQYVTDFDRLPVEIPRDEAPTAIEELVFFGRLEPRKGLPAFCEALGLLREHGLPSLKRVTFMGRHSPALGMPPEEYIAGHAETWPWDWKLISDLDRDDALAYLSEPGRLAVMASPIDNSPNTVYEAIGLGIPFVASSGGGVAELVHPDDRLDVVFDPHDPDLVEIDPGDVGSVRPQVSGAALADQLVRALGRPVRRARFAVEPGVNRETHLAWHRHLAADGRPPASRSASRSGHTGNGGPPLAVVELPGTIASPEITSSEFVLALDEGVERSPRLAATLMEAARATDGRGLVTALGTVEVAGAEGTTTRQYLPTGGPAVFGVMANCFGAGAVLGSRETLARLGVFDEDVRRSGIDATEILMRAALDGVQIDVVPEALYRVRIASDDPYRPLSRWTDVLSTARPYRRALGREAAVFVDAASELARRHRDVDGRAAYAESQLAAANARLDVITSSRSWRLTGFLRRIVARLRPRRGS